MSDRMERALADLQRLSDGHLPIEADLAEAPLLDNWRPHGPCLAGMVTGHPIISDGPCVTSLVLVVAADLSWARTLNRYYRLGRRFEPPFPSFRALR